MKNKTIPQFHATRSQEKSVVQCTGSLSHSCTQKMKEWSRKIEHSTWHFGQPWLVCISRIYRVRNTVESNVRENKNRDRRKHEKWVGSSIRIKGNRGIRKTKSSMDWTTNKSYSVATQVSTFRNKSGTLKNLFIFIIIHFPVS